MQFPVGGHAKCAGFMLFLDTVATMLQYRCSFSIGCLMWCDVSSRLVIGSNLLRMSNHMTKQSNPMKHLPFLVILSPTFQV